MKKLEKEIHFLTIQEGEFPARLKTKEHPTQTILVGTNGTGKTVYAENQALIEGLNQNRSVLVVMPDNVGWNDYELIQADKIGFYKGIRKIIYFPGLIGIICNQFHDGLIIFEDCRAYLNGKNEYDNLHRLLIRRRQHNYNILLVYHSFPEINRAVLPFCTHYVVFKSYGSIKNPMLIHDPDKLKLTMKRVNDNPDRHYYEIVEV